MVKVESGLFSELRGTLQKSRTTFQTRKSGIVAEKKPIPPPDPRGRRECIRWIYRYLCDKWNTLTPEQKEQYSETAEKHNITLFNAFLKEELTPRLWKCKLAKLNGQVLYLPLVEGEGNVAKDFSGFNNNGTIYGATWEKLTNGVNVLYFDGVDDYVNCGTDASLRPRKISVEILTNHYSVTPSMEVISQDDVFKTNKGWNLKIVDGGLYWQIGNGSTRYTVSTTISANKWYHIVALYDPDLQEDNLKLYINSELKSTYTITSEISYDPTKAVGIGGLRIGKYNGIVAIAIVYNRALSDSEISDHYELTKPYFK